MTTAATQPISIAELKATLPCTLLQLVQGRNEIKLRKDGKSWKGYCPFHRESHPSFSVFWGRDGNWRFHCQGCREDGDIFDWVRLTQRTSSFTDALHWLTNGRAAEFLAQDAPSHEIGGVVTDPQTIQRINPMTAYAASLHIRDPKFRAAKPRYWEPYNYGSRRGWVVEDLPDDAQPYPVGAGFLPGQGERARLLSEHPLVSFPKLVKTSRLAKLFRLTDDFERYGELCVGFKYRLTLEASGVLVEAAMNKGADAHEALCDELRWLARPGFTSSIPWEFDANESEEVDRLVILEGPGDGVRFYHEAYAVPELRSFFRKTHIVATDSTGSLTEASLAIPEGCRGFFDGYKHLILLMDKDSAGRRAAELISALARRQGSKAVMRDVDVSPHRDVSEFFDAGNTLLELIQLINATKSAKPQ